MGQKQSSDIDESKHFINLRKKRFFEYTEQMVYMTDNRQIHIYDLDNKDSRNFIEYKNVSQIPKSLHKANTALGYNGLGELLLVVAKDVTNKSYKNKQSFHVMIIDRHFQIKSISEFCWRGAKISPTEVLMKHLKKINFNIESKEEIWQELNIHINNCKLVKMHLGDKVFISDLAKLSYDKKRIVYPFKYGLKTHAQNVCYDRYDDKTFMVVHDNMDGLNNFVIVRCSSNGGEVLQKSRGYYFYAKSGNIPQIYHFEATRKYLLIGIRGETLWGYHSMIYILDKNSILDKSRYDTIRVLDGWHPTLYGDYENWCLNSVELLKEIEGMKKMAEDMLKLILSYVSKN
jgi:hypothetical protein